MPRLIMFILAAAGTYCTLLPTLVDAFDQRPGAPSARSIPHVPIRNSSQNSRNETTLFGVHRTRAAEAQNAKLFEYPKFSSSKNVDDVSFSLSFDVSLHKDRALAKCLLAIIAYVAVGVVSFSCIFENWPVVDSLYFSVVTFTTVGYVIHNGEASRRLCVRYCCICFLLDYHSHVYSLLLRFASIFNCSYGDLVPTTDAGKLFTMFYSFAGISIVGALLGYVGGHIIEAEKKAIQKYRMAARAAIMDLFDPKKKAKSLASHPRKQGDDGNEKGILGATLSHILAIRTRPDGSRSLLRRIFDSLAQSLYIFVPFVSLALYIGKREGWTSITSLYYAMATSSTVGYGDVAPASPRMRLLSLAFIPLAVISLGEILGRIAGYVIRKETIRAEQEFMDRRMTITDLAAMDTNHDGEVDLFEFMKFMLGSMKKVDGEMMDGLKELFQRLDVNRSNSIQKEDLILIAQKEIFEMAPPDDSDAKNASIDPNENPLLVIEEEAGGN